MLFAEQSFLCRIYSINKVVVVVVVDFQCWHSSVTFHYGDFQPPAGLYIRAGSRRSSPASLPGFAGYFHCFTGQDMSRTEMLFIRYKLLGLNK